VTMLADINQILTPYPWQQNQWQDLVARLQQNHLPHALMLRGPAGTGKAHFAVALAQMLLCEKPVATAACGRCKACHLIRAGSHPDLLLVEPEEAGKAIKVDQVRHLVEFIGRKSQYSGYRAVVICPAEAMNVNASNALLKSLEEPGEKTLLSLVSHQVSGVLPTIRSRCQVMEFPLPAREPALSWLGSLLGEDAGKAERLLNVAGGAPVLALDLNQSEWIGERSAVLQHWLGVLTGKRDPVRTAEGWQQYPLLELVSWLLAWQIDLMKVVAGVPAQVVNQDLLADLNAVQGRINPDRLFGCYGHLQQVRRMLSGPGNPNPQLLLEEILLKWSQARA